MSNLARMENIWQRPALTEPRKCGASRPDRRPSRSLDRVWGLRTWLSAQMVPNLQQTARTVQRQFGMRPLVNQSKHLEDMQPGSLGWHSVQMANSLPWQVLIQRLVYGIPQPDISCTLLRRIRMECAM